MNAAHKSSLQRKHDDLQRKISEYRTHPSASDLDIRRMQVEKLYIKECLEGLRAVGE